MEQAKRYLGTDEGILDLEALQNLLQMTTAQNQICSKEEEAKLQTCETA